MSRSGGRAKTTSTLPSKGPLPSIRRPGEIHSSRAHSLDNCFKLTARRGQRGSVLQQLCSFLPQVNAGALHRIRSSSFQPLPNDTIEFLNIPQVILNAEIEFLRFIRPVSGVVSRP